MKHQKGKCGITFLGLIWTIFGFSMCQNPSSYQNLLNTADLDQFLDKHETLFLFFYHSSLLDHKVIIQNLTRIRQMSLVKSSNVGIFQT